MDALSAVLGRITKYPFAIVFLFFISVFIAVSHSALLGFYDYYGFDQWFFAYAGQQLLDGTIPYLGFWDNKPPLIYFLNAAGLLLGGGNSWGVCVIDALFFALATCVSFIFLSKAFDRRSAFFGCCVWLMAALSPIDGGNGVTSYALPFLFMAWLGFYLLVSTTLFRRYALLLGITAALLFLLKPNFLGTHVAMSLPISLYLYQKGGWRLLFQCLLWALCGAVLILSVPVIYLLYHHAFAAFIDQVFIFPGRYLVSANYADWMRDLKFGVKMLLPFLPMGCLGLLAILVQLRQSHYLTSAQKWLAFAVVMVLPMEVFLSCLSGRPWRHYFLTWMPFLAVLSTFAVSACYHYRCAAVYSGANPITVNVLRTLRQLVAIIVLTTLLGVIVSMPTEMFIACATGRPWHSYFHIFIPTMAKVWLFVVFVYGCYRWFGKQQVNDTLTLNVIRMVRSLLPLVLLITMAISPVKSTLSIIDRRLTDFPQLIGFLDSYAGPERSLYSWGAVVKVNFLLHKPHPDRFETQEPFFIKGYATSTMVAELIASIREKKPIIVDASFYAAGVFPSLPPHIIPIKAKPFFAGFQSWGQTPEIKQSMAAFYQLIAKDYRVIAVSNTEHWVILENKSYLSDPHSESVLRLSALSRAVSHDSGVTIFKPEFS